MRTKKLWKNSSARIPEPKLSWLARANQNPSSKRVQLFAKPVNRALSSRDYN